jgi:putative ABC transport system ATP-binding protein
VKDHQPQVNSLFKTEDLKKSYVTGETEIHALKGVTKYFPSGEFVVMLGP